MKKEVVKDGYKIKIDFVGDSITPVYRFRLYEDNNKWFPKLLWEERVHRSNIGHYEDTCNNVIRKYKENLSRWK